MSWTIRLPIIQRHYGRATPFVCLWEVTTCKTSNERCRGHVTMGVLIKNLLRYYYSRLISLFISLALPPYHFTGKNYIVSQKKEIFYLYCTEKYSCNKTFLFFVLDIGFYYIALWLYNRFTVRMHCSISCQNSTVFPLVLLQPPRGPGVKMRISQTEWGSFSE